MNSHSELITENGIKPNIGGFQTAENHYWIFTNDSLIAQNKQNESTGSVYYQTNADTLLLANGIQSYTYKISADTLRLFPLQPPGEVIRVLIRQE